MKTTQTKGFTIIEVVLVLAIAGLIFLMVFVALPALQAGQRDTARRSDVGIVLSATQNFVSANRGNFPSTDSLKKSVAKLSTNSKTELLEVSRNAGAQSVTPIDGKIIVTEETTCPATVENNTAVLGDGKGAQFTVVTLLEGGSGIAYCEQG